MVDILLLKPHQNKIAWWLKNQNVFYNDRDKNSAFGLRIVELGRQFIVYILKFWNVLKNLHPQNFSSRAFKVFYSMICLLRKNDAYFICNILLIPYFSEKDYIKNCMKTTFQQLFLNAMILHLIDSENQHSNKSMVKLCFRQLRGRRGEKIEILNKERTFLNPIVSKVPSLLFFREKTDGKK